MAKIYVVSRSNNKNFALEGGNVIAICYAGPALADAKSYSNDHTKATDEPAFVYEVEVKLIGSMQTKKEVVFVPAWQG